MQGDGVYSRLGKFLGTCTNDQALAAWQKHLAEKLPIKHITAKSYIIQTLSHVLMHYDDSKHKEHVQLEQLFSLEPLLNMLYGEMLTSKKLTSKTNVRAKPAQRQMRYICRKFETSLIISFQHQLKLDTCKLAIIRPLLQLHLQLDNIMLTPRFTHQLLSQLGEQGLNQIYEFYFERFTSNDEQVTRSDREHCLKQMQHLQHTKRTKLLEFLLNASVFNLNDDQKPCTAAEAAIFSRQAASRCVESFFSCLVNKIGTNSEQLFALHEQLRPLLLPLAKKLAKPGIESKLRIKLTPEIRKIWEKVQKVLDTPLSVKEKQAQPLTVIFDALILFLGVAMLTPTTNIGLDVIDDLFICKQHALNSKQDKEKRKSTVTI